MSVLKLFSSRLLCTIFLLLIISLNIFSQQTRNNGGSQQNTKVNNIIQNVDTSQFETVTIKPGEKSLNSSQAFLNLGYQFLERKNIKKAEEYFQKCIAEEDGKISQKARIALINLKASTGDKNLLSEIESLDEADKPEAYFMLADGWATYYFENPYERDYLKLTKEYYAFLIARYKNSPWVQKTRLQLSSLYIKEKKYDFALDHLLPVLSKSKKMQAHDTSENKSIWLGFDMAWFLLGRILEESNQYKDYERAVESYTKVLSFQNSPFSKISEKKIKRLKKTFLMR